MRTALLVAVLLSPQDKVFWRAIVDAKFAVPAGESAAALGPELVTAIGDPDPEMRDALAFTILTASTYEPKLLGPDDSRPLVKTIEGQLEPGSGAIGKADVLRRSFSALTLSVIRA